MNKYTVEIDVMGIVLLVVSLMLGFTGRVSWWVIVLVWLSTWHLKFTLGGAKD